MVKKFVPKVLNRVTIPFLKILPNKPVYIRIDKPMFSGKQIEKNKEPATLVQGFEFQRGELVQMIAGAVMQNELRDQYPNDAYVGKTFEIVLHKADKANAQGVVINLYNITEIAEPDPSDFADVAEEDKTPVEESKTGDVQEPAADSGKGKKAK